MPFRTLRRPRGGGHSNRISGRLSMVPEGEPGKQLKQTVSQVVSSLALSSLLTALVPMFWLPSLSLAAWAVHLPTRKGLAVGYDRCFNSDLVDSPKLTGCFVCVCVFLSEQNSVFYDYYGWIATGIIFKCALDYQTLWPVQGGLIKFPTKSCCLKTDDNETARKDINL